LHYPDHITLQTIRNHSTHHELARKQVSVKQLHVCPSKIDKGKVSCIKDEVTVSSSRKIFSIDQNGDSSVGSNNMSFWATEKNSSTGIDMRVCRRYQNTKVLMSPQAGGAVSELQQKVTECNLH